MARQKSHYLDYNVIGNLAVDQWEYWVLEENKAKRAEKTKLSKYT